MSQKLKAFDVFFPKKLSKKRKAEEKKEVRASTFLY